MTVLAVGLGLVWSALSLSRGVGLDGFLVLSCCGALTLWLGHCLVRAIDWRATGGTRTIIWLLVTVGFAVSIGYWLKLNTNHRPLAAATFACFCLIGFVGVAIALMRSNPSWLKRINLPVLVVGGASVVGLLSSIRGAAGVSDSSLLDIGVGAVLFGGASVLIGQEKLSRIDSRAAIVAGSVIAAGCVAGIVSEAGETAIEKAPIIAGLVGLFA